jgi:hypothetical protein
MPMVLHAIVSLQAAINQYKRNAEARPFVWTASAVSIVAKLARSRSVRVDQCTAFADRPTVSSPVQYLNQATNRGRPSASEVAGRKPVSVLM